MVENGFAVASVDYRLSSEAIFPVQVFDCKAAVRWLRANAEKYGYDSSKIGVMGESAGGHLAVLLGVSGGVKELEGSIGENLEESSRVQAIVDFFGPQDFILRSEDQSNQTENKNGLVYRLLGGPVREKQDLAKLASGAYHITPDDPPLLIIHGTADQQVHFNQSQRLYDLYQESGLSVTLKKVRGGKHGGPEFHTDEINDLVLQFLNRTLRHGT